MCPLIVPEHNFVLCCGSVAVTSFTVYCIICRTLRFIIIIIIILLILIMLTVLSKVETKKEEPTRQNYNIHRHFFKQAIVIFYISL